MANTISRRIKRRLEVMVYHFVLKNRYRKFFARYGENIGWGRLFSPIIPSNIKIACPENISIGNHCQFDEFTHLLATPFSKLVIGDNVRFANGFSHVVASFDEIVIEDDCLFAAFVQIINGNHGYSDIRRPVKDQEAFSTGPIRIGRGSWIGRGACVLGGVTLGRNVVVGANAVVTKSFPDYSVVAGNPAAMIKRYDPISASWDKLSGGEA